jgi:hypothetical protein
VASPLVSGELSPRDRAVPPRLCPPQPLDLGHPSEIGQFRFNQSGSDRSPLIQIQPPFSLPPHPRPCPWARLVSPPWLADALSPPVSRARAI